MKKSLFNTGKLPWWLIGVSMMMGGGIITEPQMISAALAEGNLSGMWLMWSALFGGAVGLSFFAHLWRRVPVKTENEFLLFRFSGRGSRILHAFRAVYVGGFLVTFILAFTYIGLSNFMITAFGLTKDEAIFIITGIVIVASFFNSLGERIRLDFIFLIIFATLFIVVMSALISDAGGMVHVGNTIANAGIDFSLFPETGTQAFNAFLVFVLLQWWMASICDMPDMSGQKMMSAKSPKDVVRSNVLPGIIAVIIGLFQFMLPFIAYADGYFATGLKPELAYISVFTNHLSFPLLIAAALMFLIAFLSVILNNLNWGGSLLIQNFYRYHVRPNATDEQLSRAGLTTMIATAVAAGVVAYFSDTLFGFARYLFTIAAGVGPVFILRWYWWRINAWSQFSAMLAALILPNLFELLMYISPDFNAAIMQACSVMELDLYSFTIIVLSVIVTCIWLSVTFLTKPDDEITLKRFVDHVYPGGFWPAKYKKGRLYSGARLLSWTLYAGRGITIYLAYWSFVKADYWMAAMWTVVFMGLLFVVYRVLNKVNERAEEVESL
ncbi:MAG: hypothetical protein AB7V36_02080 [Bacteroidales bacterium]